MLTLSERVAIMEANPPQVSSLHNAATYFDWGWKGCGFGQLEVRLDDGVIIIENECMGRERVRKILHAWADFVADRAILSDNLEDIPPIDYKAEQEQSKREHNEWEQMFGRK